MHWPGQHCHHHQARFVVLSTAYISAFVMHASLLPDTTDSNEYFETQHHATGDIIFLFCYSLCTTVVRFLFGMNAEVQ